MSARASASRSSLKMAWTPRPCSSTPKPPCTRRSSPGATVSSTSQLSSKRRSIVEWRANESCGLRRARADLASVHNAGFDLTVAVNFSARQLRDVDVASLVAEVLKTCSLRPQSLEVEITETALMHAKEMAASKIKDLRDAGVRVALDDFGTGYSSLTLVQLFRPDTVKIDRQFVSALPDDSEAEAIVRAVIALARAVESCVVAEGPETEAQVRFLRSNGCDYAQGYFFSRPVTLDELMRLLGEGPFTLPGR